MKKFFAFITAILLAVILSNVFLEWNDGSLTVKELSFETIKEQLQNKISNLTTPEKDVEEDGKVIEPVIDTDPNLSYEERIKKGDYFLERGFFTFAANEYVKAANMNFNSIVPYERLLLANFELGDYSKAKRNAEMILKLDPNHTETRFALVKINIKQSSFEEAMNIIEQLKAMEIKDARIEYYRALLFLANQNFDEAQKRLKQARVESATEDINENIDKILGAYNEFDFAKAAEELYLANLISRSLNEIEEYEISIHILKNVLKDRSDLRDSWILLGFGYINLGKYYFGLTAFEQAYQLDPEWPTTQYFLGITHKELSNYNDAIVYFNYALSNGFKPELVVYNHLADLYLSIEDYEAAVSTYKQLLELNRSDINSFVKPIWIYLDFLGNPEEALILANMAVTAFPENAMAFNLLGWSQVASGNYTDAEINLKKSLEIDPGIAAAHLNLGKLYEAQLKRKEAMSAYQEAYQLDQNSSIGNLAAKRYNVLLIQENNE